MKTVLSEAQMRQFVADWYRKLDEHVPLEDVVRLVSASDLTMKFPEATLHDRSQFADWYRTVTHKFFDEMHTVKRVAVRTDGEQAELEVLVNWRASVWNPPDARSQGLNFDSEQLWVVKDEPGSDQPQIVVYDVKTLTPLPGSATL
jgi:hypothetical protein